MEDGIVDVFEAAYSRWPIKTENTSNPNAFVG